LYAMAEEASAGD